MESSCQVRHFSEFPANMAKYLPAKMAPASCAHVRGRQYQIGSPHDPYSAEELTIVNSSSGAKVILKTNGLGQNKVEFYAPSALRPFYFIDLMTNPEKKLKADLLARRLVGVDLDSAEHRLYQQMCAELEDPIGPISRYI